MVVQRMKSDMRNARTSMVSAAVGIVFGCGCAACGDSATTADGGIDSSVTVDAPAMGSPDADANADVGAGASDAADGETKDGGAEGGGGDAETHDAADAALALPGDLSIVACPGAPSVPVPAAAPSCDTICGAAHCIRAALLGSVDSTAIPGCPDDGTGSQGKCLPDAIFMTGAQFKSASCTSSLIGGTAACTPYCFAGAFKNLLQRDGCASGEVCVPCTDPTTLRPTGACSNRCIGSDGGVDAGVDGAVDAGAEGGVDAGVDGAVDAGAEGGVDTGADGNGSMDAGGN
jgi:hypothetical protein